MRELFYEESAAVQREKSASTKYYIFKIISIVSYVLCGIWTFLFVFFLSNTESSVLVNLLEILPAVLFLATGIVFGRFKNRFYVDFDYTFISGEIRISKVIKQIKRRKFMTFNTSLIEKIGKCGSDTFKAYIAMKGIKKEVLTSNNTPAEGKDFYYIVINQGVKKILIFECTTLFIINVLKFTNRTVMEKDLK